VAERSVATTGVLSARKYVPPLLNQKIFAPYKIATLIDTVATYDIDSETVLARTGLLIEEVRNPHTLTSIRQYLTACENILAAGASLATAFAVGSRLHLSAYGMYGYALMCSTSMRDFFDFAVRYHPLATPTLQLGWRQEGKLAIWSFSEIYSEVMTRDLRAFLIRQQMTQTFTHMQDVLGADNVPLRAVFAFPDSGNAGLDEANLECNCHYGYAAHELHYPASLLEKVPELGNEMTRIMIEEACDRLIGQAQLSSGIVGDVYQMVLLSPGPLPTMQAVATQFGMTERTLRRRLSDEGRSYADIIDEVRRKLTMEYLTTTRMSVEDVAWKVGFSDSPNLRRAVKRWTGQTISEIRRG
jgi:AraC-like DNA-binding protein